MNWLQNVFLASALIMVFTREVQASERQWLKRVEVASDQSFVLSAMYPQPQGGVLLIGKIIQNLAPGDQDQLIIQSMNADGRTNWRKNLARPSSAGVRALRFSATDQASDGSVVLAYEQFLLGDINRSETIVSKISLSGDLLWQRNLAETDESALSGFALETDKSGATFILGFRQSFDNAGDGASLCALAKLGSLGEPLWFTTLPEVKDCSPSSFDQSVAFDLEQSIYLSLDNAVAKLSSEGRLQWTLPGRSTAIQLVDEELYATSPQQTWAISKSGQVLWSRQDKGGMQMQIDNAGIVLASTDFQGFGNAPGIRLTHMDRKGTVQWEKRLASTPLTVFQGLSLAADGTIQIFAELGVRKGIFKTFQASMALLLLDREGKELSRVTSNESFSAWRYVVHPDSSIYLADINGSLEKFSPGLDEPIECPWFKPFCRL